MSTVATPSRGYHLSRRVSAAQNRRRAANQRRTGWPAATLAGGLSSTWGSSSAHRAPGGTNCSTGARKRKEDEANNGRRPGAQVDKEAGGQTMKERICPGEDNNNYNAYTLMRYRMS